MKKTLFVITMIALFNTLAGCGKNEDKTTASNEDKTTASVKYLLSNKEARLKEVKWCEQQPPEKLFSGSIKGCANLELADWFDKNKDIAAQIDKPEPWPGKNQVFFVAARHAKIAEKLIPLEEKAVADGGVMKNHSMQELVKYKEQLSAVQPQFLNSFFEEMNWCKAKSNLQISDAPPLPANHSMNDENNRATQIFNSVSPTCKIVNDADAEIAAENKFKGF